MKEGLLSTAELNDAHVNLQTAAACTGLHRSRPDGSLLLRVEVDTSPYLQPKSLLQSITVCKWKINFTQWNFTRLTNHSEGQAPCPAVGGQGHKKVNANFFDSLSHNALSGLYLCF